MFCSRTTRARRTRIAVALLGTVASLALPSFATAGGITAVPESAAGWEGDSGRSARIPVWTTLTCRPDNPAVKLCRFSATDHDGTAKRFGGRDFEFYGYRYTLVPGESRRLDWWGVIPLGDTTVEKSETLTVDVDTEGVAMPGTPLEQVVERTVSRPAQITIWNDDRRVPSGGHKRTGCSFC